MSETLRKARTAVVFLVIAAVVGVGWWQMHDLRSRASTDGSDAGAGLTLYRADEGVPVPQIAGKTVDGQMLDLADLRGHVVVLNVWGSWCAPCRAEAPDLAAISEETEPRGVRFVGIDVRDNPAAARAFARNYGITYPSFDDQNGLVLAQFTGIIPVSAVPSTLVVDKSGVTRASVIGRVDGSTLRGLIEDAEKTG
ncbi:TlpA family protein disulfide reductase [Nocardioides taihuensis]|uniref:TlpA family protein disulfide reductase n=1 Tax=Nocardioides taihuensis TaxID=1835606 RepID=A0ABW0BE74_9ACTN